MASESCSLSQAEEKARARLVRDLEAASRHQPKDKDALDAIIRRARSGEFTDPMSPLGRHNLLYEILFLKKTPNAIQASLSLGLYDCD